MTGIFATVRRRHRGRRRANVFQPVHPALSHFTIVGPLVMFRATAPGRARIKSLGRSTFPMPIRPPAPHLKMVARRMLAVGPSLKLREQRAKSGEQRDSAKATG